MKRLYYDQPGNPFSFKKGEHITVTEMKCEGDIIAVIKMLSHSEAKLVKWIKTNKPDKYSSRYPSVLRGNFRMGTHPSGKPKVSKIVLLPLDVNGGILNINIVY